MELSEEGRTLIREKLASLSAEHYRRIARLTKDFEKERVRLETMLRFGLVPQMMPS